MNPSIQIKPIDIPMLKIRNAKMWNLLNNLVLSANSIFDTNIEEMNIVRLIKYISA